MLNILRGLGESPVEEGLREVQSVDGVTGACEFSIVEEERRRGRISFADEDGGRGVSKTGDSGT